MSLKARVIPCLDVKDGRVVKGVSFVDLIDAGDPVESAKAYDAAGADELCFLDITASSDERDTIVEVVARTADHCFMPLTVGGGVRAIADIRRLLLAGADKVSINSAAVRDPDFVARAADKFGNQCIVVSIDAKQVSSAGETPRWELFTHGGRTATGIDALSFAEQMVERGAGELLVTSMDRDGRKSGYDLALTGRLPIGSRCRSSPLAASARWITWWKAFATAMRQPFSQPRSSISGRTALARPSATWPTTASPCGWTERHPSGQGLADMRTQSMTDFTLTDLETIVARRAGASPEESWTAKLVAKGQSRAAKKLGEEAVETVIAAIEGDRSALISESADLLYHLMVVLKIAGIPLEDVMRELEGRTAQSGLSEKANRQGS